MICMINDVNDKCISHPQTITNKSQYMPIYPATYTPSQQKSFRPRNVLFQISNNNKCSNRKLAELCLQKKKSKFIYTILKQSKTLE